jgi:hypothetical protein
MVNARIEEMQPPTLLVGLGGTGKVILTHLKARMIEESRRTGQDLLQRVRFRLLDIDPREEVAYLTDGTPIVLDPATEFIDIGDVPVRDVRRQMDEGAFRDTLNTWFDKNIILIEENLRKGAQQIRQLGRLAFFWHLDERRNIYNKLEGAVREVTDLAKLARPHGEVDIEATRPLSIDVFVVSSLCGGTGSGMLIDVAYVLQDLFYNRAQWDRVTLNAVLIMPNVFVGAPQRNLRPNTLAALREINYFQTRDDRKFTTIKHLYRQLECSTPPFKIVYLVDAIAQDGRNLERPQGLFPMVVDALFLQVGSKVRAAVSSMVNNVRSIRNRQEGTVYSSFGVASLVLPVREMTGIYGTRLGREIIEKELLAELSDAARGSVNSEVDRFLGEKELSADRVERYLSYDEQNRLFIARLQQAYEPLRPARLAGISREALFATVTTHVQQAAPTLVAESTKKVAEMRDRLLNRVIEDRVGGIQATVGRFLGNPEHGIPYALEFLRVLKNRLDSLAAEVERKRLANDQQRASTERAMEASRAAFQRAAAGRIGLLGDPTQARDDYLRRVQQWLDAQFSVAAAEEAKRAIGKMLDVVEEQRRSLEDLRGVLRWLANSRLPEIEDKYRQNFDDLDLVRRKSVLSLQEIDALYNSYKGNRESGAYFLAYNNLFRQEGGLASLVGLKREEIEKQILVLIQEAFPSLRTEKLERIIEQKEEQQGISRRQWLEATKGQAVRFWPYRAADEDARGHRMEYISVIGLERVVDSIYKDVVGELGQITADTENPHMITVLNTEHGMTYRTMTQYAAYLQEYKRETQRKGAQPVHCFPEFILDDPALRNIRSNGKEARELFALALAYGLIKQQPGFGDNPPTYTYVSAKKTKKVVLSEKGLFDAVWEFVHNPELVEKTKTEIRALEDKGSPADLAQKLKTAMTELEYNPEEEALADELKSVMEERSVKLRSRRS